MSFLYLDEEMTVGSYLYIAERLASSGTSLDELDAIFFAEVHSVLCWNMKTVAGHWDDFGKEWVAESIAKNLRGHPEKGWLVGVRERRKRTEAENLKTFVRCDWEKVKLLIEVIRGRGLSEIDK